MTAPASTAVTGYPDYVRDDRIALSENSREVLRRRYLRKGLDGKPIETPAQMFYRVARHIASAEARFGGAVEATTRLYYDLLTSLRFFPNSPTFTGAGTPLGQLAACFTADMRVTTEQGVKRIADLQIGDRVLTHLGRYRPVTELYQRAYSGTLLRIKIKLIGTTLEVTPEHPIMTPAGWVRADELRVGDKVAVGIPQGIRLAPHFDLAESVYADELELQVAEAAVRVRRPSAYQNSGRQATWVNRFIELTPDLARLCGYYVAEGTLGPNEQYVRFTLGRHEAAYQDDICHLIEQIFHIAPGRSHSNHGHWTNINVYSRAVASWFRNHFGHHSYGKRIPTWLQYAPLEIQRAFLIGLIRGDGLYWETVYKTTDRKSPRIMRALRMTLGNPGLVQQVWQMCLRLGYDAAIRPVDTTYVTQNARATAQISLPPLQSRDLVQQAFGVDLPEPDIRYIRNSVTRQGNTVYFEIDSIEAEAYTGIVYNCEVDEDHSYVTEGIVVHNCFVLPIEDDMGKHPDGIFQTLRNAALIQQTGGGNGFSFGRLRPRGDKVLTSAGVATGPVGFLEAFDKAFGVIAQGGTRRGANMAVLPVHHPDIEEFITCKAEEGRITNFNISVGVTDAFMQAVIEDKDFDLINPRDGKVWRTVRARDLFDKIATHAHRNGEPGVLFLDTANRTNPVPHLYELEATNPCGEQWLGPYENCCLGSVNLARHVTEDNSIDWDLLAETVATATRFLDDVVEVNAYVPAVPQLKEAAYRVRRIGLGIMGLADVMYMLGVRYGSEEGEELAAQIMEFVRYHAMRTSIELARERGPFPAIRGSIYDPTDLKWTPPTPLTPYKQDFGRPPLNWDAIVAGIKAHGIRNGAQTTIAPTGTIGTVTGCEGYGCEPVFALAYTRYVKEADGDVPLTYVSPLFLRALDEAGIVGETRQRIINEILHTGTCQHIGELPDHILHTFVVSQDITSTEHVRIQAALQRFVDNSISKTINFPPTATVEDVKTAYRLAWELGCKGITVYVTGSREEVVLETKTTAIAKGKTTPAPTTPAPTPTGEPPAPPVPPRKRRPTRLQGFTYRQPTPLGTAYITVNSDDAGEPFEVFLNVGKAGSDVAAVAEALGRLMSYILRMPSPLPPRERLQQIVYQLGGIGGGRPLGFGPQRVRSLPDAIAQVLSQYLNESEAETLAKTPPPPAEQMELPLAIGDLCPDCGQASMLFIEGCKKCQNCGYSEC
jgi:ribonucleoside-diphosphate reductase alpha chain